MNEPGEETIALQSWIQRLKNGDPHAREELLRRACDRLLHLTRKMKGGFARVGRWEQTDDVLQNASLRLWKALEAVEVVDVRHFFRLAATQIRRELIDLSRRHMGPDGIGAHLRSQQRGVQDSENTIPLGEPADLTRDPQIIEEWSEFHLFMEHLPEDQREVVDLLWYHGLSQQEAADALSVSTRQIKRLWRAARLELFQLLGGTPPGE